MLILKVRKPPPRDHPALPLQSDEELRQRNLISKVLVDGVAPQCHID
jgi:hypothetical protein